MTVTTCNIHSKNTHSQTYRHAFTQTYKHMTATTCNTDGIDTQVHIHTDTREKLQQRAKLITKTQIHIDKHINTDI